MTGGKAERARDGGAGTRRPARQAQRLADKPSGRDPVVRVVWALVSAYIIALPPPQPLSDQRL